MHQYAPDYKKATADIQRHSVITANNHFAHTNLARNINNDVCIIKKVLRKDYQEEAKITEPFQDQIEIDKQSECARLGFPWIRPDEENKQLPHLLPNCVSYLQLSLVDNGLVDCGSHQVALCKVDAMYQNESLENADDDGEMNYLDTASLRRMGIITKQGRVAEEEQSHYN